MDMQNKGYLQRFTLKAIVQAFDSKTHWQNIYEQQGATEVSWFQSKLTTSLEFIANRGLERSDPIINLHFGMIVRCSIF